MKNVILLAVLAAACSSDHKSTPDAPAVVDNPQAECFQGTPQTHDQLINACVDQSVTRIIKYSNLAALQAALPKLNADGTVPPPP